MSIVSSLFRSTLDVLFPSRCIGCGGSGAYICVRCLSGTRRPPAERPAVDGPLTNVLTPFTYESIARTAVQHLKYRGLRTLAPEMARPMAWEVAVNVPPPFTLVPVPLHPRRLRERGFNQAELLAREVARALDAPLALDLLKRKEDTSSQVNTETRAERLRNVSGAFASPNPLNGETIVLVDDVTTTGATLSAAALALLSAGASQVYGLTYAHEA